MDHSPGQRAQTHQDKGHNSEDQLPARTQTCHILVFELPDGGSSSLSSRCNGEPQDDGNVASEGSATEEKDGSQKKVLPGEYILQIVRGTTDSRVYCIYAKVRNNYNKLTLSCGQTI